MPTTVTIVLRKEYADEDPELKTAADSWNAGGWVLAGAEFKRRQPCDATHILHGILLADAARANELIRRLAKEARQSGDLAQDPEALALAEMYYGA